VADTAYDLWLQALLAGTYDIATASVKMMLVRIGAGHYVPNFHTDQFVNIIAGGDQIAISPALSSKTITDGVFAAANTVFTAVPAGPAAGALVLFIDTGSQASSPLIYYLDSYSGLPVTPSGADIDVVFSGLGIFEVAN
jgi:hypothetical protein